jgi:hypothetical protein
MTHLHGWRRPKARVLKRKSKRFAINFVLSALSFLKARVEKDKLAAEAEMARKELDTASSQLSQMQHAFYNGHTVENFDVSIRLLREKTANGAES